MDFFVVKKPALSGSDFREVHQKALPIYNKIKKKTKRRSYIRSVYFGKDKIFLQLFWNHLFEKCNWRDRMRRLRYLP